MNRNTVYLFYHYGVIIKSGKKKVIPLFSDFLYFLYFIFTSSSPTFSLPLFFHGISLNSSLFFLIQLIYRALLFCFPLFSFLYFLISTLFHTIKKIGLCEIGSINQYYIYLSIYLSIYIYIYIYIYICIYICVCV